MGKIIRIRFRRPRLRPLQSEDGWCRESPPVRAAIIVFPKRSATGPKAKAPHLILITSGT
jgi:hypothetical protein